MYARDALYISTHNRVARRPGHAPGQSEPPPASLVQVLEAAMRSVPKLKEQNYPQWKNAVTNSIKNAKLWGYVDGSIEKPLDENTSDLVKYFNEAGAVRNAILGSLEPGAQKYIEETLGPRDAWLALEKNYLISENDTNLLSIEQQLADLKLEEGGDVIEHIANFCRLRRRLNKTRLELDEQASTDMLYRSLPPSHRQSILSPERTEMKDFSVLCARLRDLNSVSGTQAPAAGSSPPAENHTQSGVPQIGSSFTDRPSSTTHNVTETLINSLSITGKLDAEISTGGPYYFVKASGNEKAAAFWSLFPFLSVEKVVMFCSDHMQIRGGSWMGLLYYLDGWMGEEPHVRERVMREFKEWSNRRSDRTALVIYDTALPLDGLVDMYIPLINYDVPNKVEYYARRLSKWRKANPWQIGGIITIVAPDTNEMQILRDFEKRYGVRMTELLWDGHTCTISWPNTRA